MSIWTQVQIPNGPTNQPERVSVHMVRAKGVRARPLTIHPDRPRASSPINGNYCVNVLKAELLARSRKTLKCFHLLETPKETIDIQTSQPQSVNFYVVNLAHIVEGHLQKRDASPCCCKVLSSKRSKICEGVSSFDQLSFVKPVANVPAVASDLPEGARLQSFWKT